MFLLLLSLVVSVLCQESYDDRIEKTEKGPPIATTTVLRIISMEGEEVHVSCPIEGHPTPIIEWSKDGNIIDHTWTRLKASKKVLRIRNVEVEDTGVLVCRGINGFGTKSVRVEIIVKGKDESGDVDDSKTVKPVFTPDTKKLQSFYKKLPGDSFSLHCESLGVPPPKLSWLHNKVPVSESSVLDIGSLRESDSGIYTCLASNSAGQSARQFSLTVESPRVDLPVVSSLSNLTVKPGASADLRCEVSSRLTPDIQWLKRTSQTAYSIMIGDMMLVSAGETSSLVRSGEETYTSTLTIEQVGEEDAGQFVCLATNTAGGFNYKSTDLTVLGGTKEDKPISLVMYLVIGLSSLVLILLVIIFICLIRSRHKYIREFESNSTLIYQTINPSVYKQPSDQYTDMTSVHLKSPASVYKQRPGLQSTNIYDVPYSTTQYTPIHRSDTNFNSSSFRTPVNS